MRKPKLTQMCMFELGLSYYIVQSFKLFFLVTQFYLDEYQELFHCYYDISHPSHETLKNFKILEIVF